MFSPGSAAPVGHFCRSASSRRRGMDPRRVHRRWRPLGSGRRGSPVRAPLLAVDPHRRGAPLGIARRIRRGHPDAVGPKLPGGRSCSATSCALCAPVLYERFAQAPNYDKFIAEMASGGFQRLLDDKPVLLRLVASLTRQWLATTREFVTRLHTDIDAIRRDLLNVPHASAVARHPRRTLRSAPRREVRALGRIRRRPAGVVQAQRPANRCCLAAARRTPECSRFHRSSRCTRPCP